LLMALRKILILSARQRAVEGRTSDDPAPQPIFSHALSLSKDAPRDCNKMRLTANQIRFAPLP
jgi:hypothetical protein